MITLGIMFCTAVIFYLIGWVIGVLQFMSKFKGETDLNAIKEGVGELVSKIGMYAIAAITMAIILAFLIGFSVHTIPSIWHI